ncbi:MAG: metallophosphoesterase family protein [Candidatus Brocadiia bacterium]
MRKATMLFLAGLLAATAAAAGPYGRGQVVVGPYLTRLGADCVSISWRTKWLTEGWAEVELPSGERRLQGSSGRRHFHRVTFAGLPANTRCSYRLVVDGEAGPAYSFATGPRDGRRFRFATYGDTQDGPGAHRRIAEAIRSHRPAFVVHTGDFVEHGGEASQWFSRFFRPAGPLLREAGLVPAMGNREAGSPDFCRYFGLPPEATWYAWTYGSVDFFVLDSNRPVAPGSPQHAWLRRALKASRATWKVVACHHPLYSGGRHGGDADLRQHLLPLLWEHGVDLVCVGHDHIYERTRPIGTGGEPWRNAFVQIVSGGGGADLYEVVPGPWTAHAASRHNFTIVDVSPDRMVVTAYTDANKAFDRVCLRRPRSRREPGDAVAAEALEFLLSAKQIADLRFPHGGRKAHTEQFRLTVANPSPSELRGRIDWHIRHDAWTVAPARRTVRVPPGGKAELEFVARLGDPPRGNLAELVPLATLSTNGHSITVPAFLPEARGLPIGRLGRR